MILKNKTVWLVPKMYNFFNLIPFQVILLVNVLFMCVHALWPLFRIATGVNWGVFLNVHIFLFPHLANTVPGDNGTVLKEWRNWYQKTLPTDAERHFTPSQQNVPTQWRTFYSQFYSCKCFSAIGLTTVLLIGECRQFLTKELDMFMGLWDVVISLLQLCCLSLVGLQQDGGGQDSSKMLEYVLLGYMYEEPFDCVVCNDHYMVTSLVWK
jgi:hypothetical protein